MGKNFKSPTMDFLSGQPLKKDGVPEGYKIDPRYIETRSKRFQILLQPSVLEAAKAKAAEDGVSTNEVITQAIKQYLGIGED